MMCDYLSILQNRPGREVVCRFAISLGKKSRKSQLQQCIDWYRYAQPTRKNNKVFLIPFDHTTGASAAVEHEEDSEEFPSDLVTHRICGHSLRP
eukprot:scaffold47073_cov59-Attheya_sp.AAC.2